MLYCTLVTYKILYINYTAIKKYSHEATAKKKSLL